MAGDDLRSGVGNLATRTETVDHFEALSTLATAHRLGLSGMFATFLQGWTLALGTLCALAYILFTFAA